jgi:tetratricopeptide (TPR) repeat protein
MTESHKIQVSIFIIIIALSGFVVYLNSLPGPFLWDDINLISNNPYIGNLASAPKILFGDIGSGSRQNYGFYRPLQIFSYLVDYHIWGSEVMGYHLTGVLLHILVALSVFWLALVLFKDEILSFFAGLLYAVHPIHTEAVAYISGRTDPLSALFLLVAAVFYIRAIETPRILFYALTLFSFFLALLSREYSLIFPVLMLVYHYAFRKRVDAKFFVSVIIVSLLYLVLRGSVMTFGLSQLAKNPSPIERVPGFFAAIAEYCRLIVLPLDIHMAYGQKTFYFTDIQALIGLAIFAGMLVFMLKSKDKLVKFSIAWFLVALVPVSNILPQLNAVMAAHWLYLPSIGIFILAGKGLSVLYNNSNTKKISLMLLAFLLIFYSILTIEQNNYWNDPKAFFERTIKYAPESYSWKLYYHLANERLKVGKTKEAIALYKKSLSLNGQFADTYNKLGEAYAETGDVDRAIFVYKKALWIDPSFTAAYKNLAVIYRKLGRADLAVKYDDLAGNLTQYAE